MENRHNESINESISLFPRDYITLARLQSYFQRKIYGVHIPQKDFDKVDR